MMVATAAEAAAAGNSSSGGAAAGSGIAVRFGDGDSLPFFKSSMRCSNSQSAGGGRRAIRFLLSVDRTESGKFKFGGGT